MPGRSREIMEFRVIRETAVREAPFKSSFFISTHHKHLSVHHYHFSLIFVSLPLDVFSFETLRM